MNASGRRPWVSQILRWSVAGLAMAALGLGISVPRANAQTAVPNSATAKSARARRCGGAHEGIHVSGYWVIEVKNPDGKVTSHREFENTFQESGQQFLANALTSNNLPGGFAVTLNGGDITWLFHNEYVFIPTLDYDDSAVGDRHYRYQEAPLPCGQPVAVVPNRTGKVCSVLVMRPQEV